MRTALNRLYTLSGYLAALFMIVTLVMVMLGVLGRHLNFHIRGTDAYAGYAMAAAGFLALASTFTHGEHIRVTLFTDRLNAKARRAVEMAALVIATFFAGIFAWFSIQLCVQSLRIHDVSQGNDATPLWIPQIGMALGASVFALALVDALVATIRGLPLYGGAFQASQSPKNME
jgi:TRAP-type C4-dicarboxylate transport system permease small subunit